MSKREKRALKGKGVVELVEEAYHLARQAPAGVLASYYIGSVPFALGLLYFHADMSQNAFAADHCAEAALGLTILFLWMKSWQAIYARALNARIRGAQTPEPWAKGQIARLVVAQTIIQPTAILLMPLALLMVFPFGAAHAFYQNVTILGDGSDEADGALRARCYKQAMLWTNQNRMLIWLLSPWMLTIDLALILGGAAMTNLLFGQFGALADGIEILFSFLLVFGCLVGPFLCPAGFLLALNLALTLYLVPQLLHSILGIDTVFTLSGVSAFNNTTFLATVCVATWLCLDPLLKAAYVARCFYGESLRTGEDLLAELRPFRKSSAARLSTLLLLGFILLFPARSHAAQPPDAPEATPRQVSATENRIDPERLDASIQETIRERRYAWRLPREKSSDDEENDPENMSFWDYLVIKTTEAAEKWRGKINRLGEKISDWLSGRKGMRPSSDSSLSMNSGMIQLLLWSLIALLLSIVGVLLYRLIQRRRGKALKIDAKAVDPAIPDLEDENVGADELPVDEWLKLAREMAQSGDRRLALRAYYLALLAWLIDRGMIRFARCKSNRDYERELARRSHSWPETAAIFSSCVSMFDKVWYGSHEATQETILYFEADCEKMLRQESNTGEQNAK